MTMHKVATAGQFSRLAEGGDTTQLTFSPVRKGEPLTIGAGFSALQFRHSDYPENAMSPFVMVDHFEMWRPTFDVHPHAGMSAVTLVFEDSKGRMTSRDSIGHEATLRAGDLHWTLAGRGILHTQLPADAQTRIHALQIFVNLPARSKCIEPDSFHVAASNMPEIRYHGGRVRVVAGEFEGLRSPARPPEPVLMLDGYLDIPHASVSVPVPSDWNAWVHVVDGSLNVGGTGALSAGQAVCANVQSAAGSLLLETHSAAHFVVLAGPRIDEPIIQHGPFVFESEASLARALADLEAGRFGQVDAHL